MKSYVSPVVVESDDMFEGVYTASGAVAPTPSEGPSGQTPAPGESVAAPTPTEAPTATPAVEISRDCWTVEANSVQEWSGSHNVFEVKIVHDKDVQHISSKTKVTLTFSSPLTDAYSEFGGATCSFSGNTVTIERELLADAYASGDNATYKVWVKAADEATTRALTCTGTAIECTHETNVQGVYD